MSEEHVEPLPCPICARPPRVWKEWGNGTMREEEWYVQCHRWEYPGPRHNILVSAPSGGRRDAAIAAWNTRATPAPSALPEDDGKLIERLGKAIDGLNRLTGCGEDFIWRPADRARSALIEAIAKVETLSREIERGYEPLHLVLDGLGAPRSEGGIILSIVGRISSLPQRVRAETLEEAAKVADEHHDRYSKMPSPTGVAYGRSLSASEIAKAIRSLSTGSAALGVEGAGR